MDEKGNTPALQVSVSILIIEDHTQQAELAKLKILSSWPSIYVEIATTLETAKKACERREFDLIILDLGLPDSQGQKYTIESVRSFSGSTPIMIFTGDWLEALNKDLGNPHGILIKGSYMPKADLLLMPILDKLAGRHTTITVLYVEDNESDYKMTIHLLKDSRVVSRSMQSLKFIHVTSMEDAIPHLQKTCPDCILMDLNLPRMTPIESMVELRRHCDDTPVVILSGNDDPAIEEKIRKMGVSSYIHKNQANGDLIFLAIQAAVSRRQVENLNDRIMKARKAFADGVAIAEESLWNLKRSLR